MRKFIIDVFKFLVILLIFNGLCYFFATRYYYKGYGQIPNKRYSKFIMADSHGLPIGKFSEQFNVYNFSAGSDSYFDIKRKIRYLLKKDYDVKVVYITVDDHMLSPYRESTNNLDRSVFLTSIIDYDTYISYLKEKVIKYYFPIFQPKIGSVFRSYLKSKIRKNVNENKISADNNYWWKLPENQKKILADNRIQSHFCSKNKSEILEKELLEIINLCQDNDIELIGVKFPLTRTYLKSLGTSNYGADELFYSNGLKVIDQKSVFVDNDEYFFNQDHLNTQGGKKFATILLSK